jgi:hypothetical protein
MATVTIPYKPQPRQIKYHQAKDIDELLYGGAAGGGKSEATIWDSLKYAVQYKGSRQVIFRRTFPDLQRSIIMRTLQAYPKALCKYNQSKHEWLFINGSVIELAYWDNDSNYMNYQGAEYDVIRWEELTQFEERWYIYMLSRLRSGGNDYPKAVKSTTNPGGVGHSWVKRRFIDIGEPEKVHNVPVTDDNGVQLKYPPQHPRSGELAFNRVIFFPANVFDNMALMNNDPNYLMRLMALPDNERKQLLEGDWDTFAGQYFSEFSRSVHVIEPFAIPSDWKRYRAMDEGYNDPYVCLWVAMDREGNAYLYREFVKSKLLSHEQAEETIRRSPNEKFDYNVGDTSFWNKGKESGKSPFEVFAERGLPLVQATKERINGWKRLREWLHVYDDVDKVTGQTFKTARLKIFSNCLHTIESIPSMIVDEIHPEDIEEHSLDHVPDALRYWCMSRPSPTKRNQNNPDTSMEARILQNIKKLSKPKKGVQMV